MGASTWGAMRSARRRDELGNRKVGRATALRVLRFARPYRRHILVFLVLVVGSSAIGVATPLLAGDVINAITSPHPGAGATVIRIALLIAGLAVLDAALSMGQ